MSHFYRPQTKFAKVMFLHVSVIMSTGVGGLPHCMLGYTSSGPEAGTPHDQRQVPPRTRGRYPPGPEAGTPPEQTPLGAEPPSQCMLGDTGNKRAVRILLECNLVY